MIRFLLDAQLPRKLAFFLQDNGFDAIHTLDLPLQNKTTDSQINTISIEQERIVITKDRDFLESFLISNRPYKLIIVTTGNITNKTLLELFSKNIELITTSIEKNSLIELTASSVIVKQ